MESIKIDYTWVNHGFIFIDPIKIEPNQLKFLELFGLTLNNSNTKTQSIGIASVEIISVENFMIFFQIHCYLFYLFFIFI